MLPSLASWLQTLSPEFGFFRVFQYLTFRAVMAAMTAMLMFGWSTAVLAVVVQKTHSIEG